MPAVKVKENEPFDVALRRFKRSCEKAGVLSEVRRREFYEKPTAVRKRKAAAAVKRHLKKLQRESRKFVPEGVEGAVPYRGSLSDLVYQFVGGLRSTMGYCGCGTIDELRNNARFVRITGASLVESHPHDITITRESSNYTTKNGGS